MSWIKRNLSLVISGAIALGLLGVGAWYLWSAIQKNNAIDTEVGGTKSEIERLLNMDPAPNQSNLNTLKREFDRLTAFNAQARRMFPSTPAPPGPLNNQSFNSLLQTTIDGLHKQASSVGIKVDPDYYFTFESQRLPVTFAPESLHPLSERLHEVQSIASILFKSRINRLEGIRRAVVPGEQPDPKAASDYLPSQPRGNAETGMVLWPYEVTFQCFTSEMAGVLEALQRAQYGFIVKAPSSEPARDVASLPPPLQPPGQPPGRRFNPPAGANVPLGANPPPGLITVLNEKLLRVTLRIEVIKPEAARPGR